LGGLLAFGGFDVPFLREDMRMRLSRRDFLKLAGALGVASTFPVSTLQKALGGTGDPRVIWMQGQSCSGCSISLMNAVTSASCSTCTTVDDLLVNLINLEYHSTLIAAAGELALSGAFGPHPSLNELSAMGDNWLATGTNKLDLSGPSGVPDGQVNLIDFAALCKQGYILVVEGAIPFGSEGKFCDIGGHTTMTDAFSILGQNADLILAVGSCASYGGIPAAGSNPTDARSVTSAMSALGIQKPVVKIPGCPMHPEWFVGTVVKLLAGTFIIPDDLDSQSRPKQLFGDSGDMTQRIHAQCPLKGGGIEDASALGGYGCLENFGCRGKGTWANCPSIKWNGPNDPAKKGVSWCVQSRTPCYGCTESNYPGTNDLVKLG
jgi:hydrogenase small subunit